MDTTGSAPTRRSRADRRAQTVTDLIATARTAFLRDGYGATSLDAIAEAAGYSKGAVYSNFKDKPTLCGAVLADIHEEKLREIKELTPRSDAPDVVALAAAFGEWVRRSLGDVGWTMLEFEYVVLSRTDPAVRDSIIELRARARDAIADLLEKLFGDLWSMTAALDDATAVPSPTELADLILSTGIGLSVQRAVDPSVSVEPAVEIITSLATLVSALRDG